MNSPLLTGRISSVQIVDSLRCAALRVDDLRADRADLLEGRPFDGVIDMFRRHGTCWDQVDVSSFFECFDPKNVNVYNVDEPANPRIGFFGAGNPVANKDKAVAGMELRQFFAKRSQILGDYVASNIMQVALTELPLFQHVHVKHREISYFRLLLPSSRHSAIVDRVISLTVPHIEVPAHFGPVPIIH